MIKIIIFIQGHTRKKDEFYSRLFELANDKGYQMWKENRKVEEDVKN